MKSIHLVGLLAFGLGVLNGCARAPEDDAESGAGAFSAGEEAPVAKEKKPAKSASPAAAESGARATITIDGTSCELDHVQKASSGSKDTPGRDLSDVTTLRGARGALTVSGRSATCGKFRAVFFMLQRRYAAITVVDDKGSREYTTGRQLTPPTFSTGDQTAQIKGKAKVVGPDDDAYQLGFDIAFPGDGPPPADSIGADCDAATYDCR